MKTMLGLVAVVAIIATTGAFVPEYSIDDAYVYSTADPDEEVTTAKLLNAETQLKFNLSNIPTEEGIVLIPNSSQNSTGIAKGGCGTSVGIAVTNIGQTFCNISYFLLAVDSFDVDHNSEEVATENVHAEVLQLMVYFDNNGKPFLIEMPIFKVPSDLASADKEELQSWAVENEVGINSPVDIEMLTNISEKGEWKGDFKWLSDLISYGIVKSEGSYHIKEGESATKLVAYTARPLVLSAETIDKFIQVVNKYKKKMT